jgi:hypothetical protein
MLCMLQATSLRHPFIVPCVESWVVQNHTVNMIYAFCQNGDLSGYLTKIRKQVKPVPETLLCLQPYLASLYPLACTWNVSQLPAMALLTQP